MNTSRVSESYVSKPILSAIVIFRLGEDRYALDVEVVMEVVRMVAIAPIPEAPPWLSGVVDFRGRVVPVIDLRVRLGLPERTRDPNTPIVLARTETGPVGLIVDEMETVATVSSDSIEPPDEMAGSAHAVSGVVRLGHGLILLLDLSDLLTDLSGSEMLDDRAEATP
ncbi:MAG: chemotaxis protein CheW [Actinobacteria bacterium]|nr:chemotaxis protein CheW [Actinomycetota bacterium]